MSSHKDARHEQGARALSHRIFFESSPDGIFLLETDGLTLVNANDAFYRMLGFTREELPDGTFFQAFSTTPPEATRNNIQRLRSMPDKAGHFLTRYRRKDGSIFHARLRAFLVRDQNTEFLVVRISDVTREIEADFINRISNDIDQQILQKRPLEEVFRKTIEALATSFQFPAIYLAVMKPDGSVDSLHATGNDMVLAHEVLEILKTITKDSEAVQKTMLGQTIATRQDLFFDQEALASMTLSGWYRLHEVTAGFSIPVNRKENPVPYAILGFFGRYPQDLSPDRQTHLRVLAGRIQESYARFKQQLDDEMQKEILFSEAPFGIALLDPDSLTLVNANKAFLAMAGLSQPLLPRTILLKDLLDLPIDQWRREQSIDPEKSVLPGDNAPAAIIKKRCRRADGSTFHGEVTLSRVQVGDQTLLSLNIRDKTAEILTEAVTSLSLDLDRMILKGTDLPGLLTYALRKIHQVFPFAFTYFALTNELGTVCQLLVESEDERFTHDLREITNGFKWDTSPGNKTLLVQSLTQKKPIYASLGTRFHQSSLSDWLEARGLKALYAHPSHESPETGKPWGALVAGVKNENDLSPEIRKHLSLIMDKLEVARTSQKEWDQIQTDRNNIFEEAPDGIYILDPHTLTLMEANQVFCRMIGVENKNQIIGVSITTFSDASAGEIHSLFSSLSRSNIHSSSVRRRFTRQNGSHLNVLVSFSRITFQGKEAFLTHIREITHEIQTEEITRVSREVDRLILQGSSLDELLGMISGAFFKAFSLAGVTFALPGENGTFHFNNVHRGFSLSPEAIALSRGARWNTPPFSETTLGKALCSRSPQFAAGEGLKKNPLSQNLHELGIEAIYALPVLHGPENHPLAILVLWAYHPDDLNEHLRTSLADFTDKVRLAFSRMEEQNKIRLGQSAMESSQSPMLMTRPDGQVLWANPAFYTMIGSRTQSPEEIRIPALFPCPAEKTKTRHLAEAFLTGDPFEGIETGWTLDHKRISVRAILSPLKTDREKWTHNLIHFNDITRELELSEIDRLIAELDLKVLKGDSLRDLLMHLSRRVRKIHEAVWVHIMTSDPKGNLWTQAFAGESNRIADIVRSLPEPVHTSGDTLSISAAAIRSGRHEQIRVREMDEDFPFRRILVDFGVEEVHAFPFRATEGRPGIVAIMLKNIDSIAPASQERIEQLLKRLSNVIERYSEQERLRLQEAAMENVANGIMITDTSGRIESVNEALTHLSGYSREELVGETPRLLKSGRHDPSLYQSLWETLLAGRSCDNIFINKRKDGSFFTVESSITPMRSPSGKITHFIQIQKDVSQRIQKDREIWNLANIDLLTGLFNRQAFLNRLKTEIRRSAREGHSLILLFLDLDGFKEINDSLGHAAGDTYLKVIAERLQNGVRANDLVARLGGDEFVILLTEVSDILAVSSFVTKTLETVTVPVAVEEREVHTGASIGLSIYPKDAVDAEDLLRKADIAMYQVKSHDKNGWLFYNPEMEEKIRRRFNQENALRAAIANHEFVLYYQPQIDISKNRLVGVEALIRWKKASGEIISPGEFIPLAEETGLILPLGEWILEEVFRTVDHWHKSGRPRIRVAMNVSVRQFWTQNFWDLFTRMQHKHPELSRWMTLELTESLLMRDPSRARDRLLEIRNQGVKIAIDDFGTGYSSLSYLTRLPVDVLKVPQEFVLQMKNSSLDLAMVKTIIQMAKTLSLHLVGEGAETQSEVDILTDLECLVLQGYAISRPLPLDQIEAFMDRDIPMAAP